MKSWRILVADDNEDAAESLSMILETDGHTVLRAHDGEAALHAAGAFRPEIAFVDIEMPKLNGYDVARRIRLAPWGGSIRLIALTGWGRESDRLSAVQAGFDTHLVKPVAVERLTEILAELRKPAEPPD